MTTTDCTILYVEDDVDFAELNIRWFEQQGYRTVHAPNGTEAIKAFKETAPDIVLLDIMLPDMTGFEVFKQIQETNENIPVIFLTSLSDTRNAIKGLESGAYDYIRKDTDLEETEARIKVILTRTGYNTIVPITDSCHIDNRKLAVVIQGKEHSLNNRSIGLLQLLLQHKNHICKRDFLTTKIWGGDKINADIYLNQAVGTLRRVLSADKRITLKSFRNAGIMLEIDN